MEAGAILEPYRLSYSDLITHSSDVESSSSSADEIRRLETLYRGILENLGPTGPGLLAITGVPGASALRNTLLPLARELALLPNEDRKRILKEHGVGSDVPLKNLDRTVSSFAMQLKYGQCWDLGRFDEDSKKDGNNLYVAEAGFDDNKLIVNVDDKFKNVGNIFRELGFCMMHLGLRLARICDRAIGGEELEKSLLESCSAKGRLIHYHSALDTHLIKEAGSKKGSKSRTSRDHESSVNGVQGRSFDMPSELWQQWHYDYGIFTVLTRPMFISTSYDRREDGRINALKSSEHPSPSGHSCLQIFDPTRNKVRSIKAPPGSFIVQVGESADVLSRGKLRATLHSVSRSMQLENLSRGTFVVFLQPTWTKVFDISEYPMERQQPTGINGLKCGGTGKEFENDELKKQNEEIYNIVPQLSSRLKSGMTFAEFSQETTKQYYGGGGLQPNR